MRAVLLSLPLLLAGVAAAAEPRIDAVAAGDPTATSAILWTRAADDARPVSVRAEVATDPRFTAGRLVFTATTVAEDDFTARIAVDGLRPGTRYHYRFCLDPCVTPVAGRFTTAFPPDQTRRLRFGFTGDADGRFRPYPAASDIGARDLDFFIFLGDTIYESESRSSPPTINPSPTAPAAATGPALESYFRKYRENILGARPDGTADPAGPQYLKTMRQAAGHYTMLDNHELGSGVLAAGGGPVSPGAGEAGDVNPSGPYINATPGFLALMKAFHAYHPTRVSIAGDPAHGYRVSGPTVDAPADPRSHGTARNWFSQRWGARAVYIQTDGRLYRDRRLSNGRVDDTGPRADNPGRTMLGRTQLEWLKATLMAEERAGVTWKFVAIASPIDQVGRGARTSPTQRWPVQGTQDQDGKSWFGGYRAERNDLLGFIAEQGIRNVVFLTTDDHFVRVTTLRYRSASGAMMPVPGAFHIVSGPIGAGGPDVYATDPPARRRQAVESASHLRETTLREMGQPPTGLPANWPGLAITHRRFGSPGGPPRPLDFYIPDQFAYTVLQVDANGSLLVETFGVASYPANLFPRDRRQPTHLMGFRVAPR